MKRLIPVLAIALILVLCSSNDAFSKRYPDLRKETVQWDHPWGGEHQNNDENPPFTDATPSTSDDLNVIDIFKTWFKNISPFIDYRLRFLIDDNDGDTDVIIPDSQPQTETNQTTVQGGF